MHGPAGYMLGGPAGYIVGGPAGYMVGGPAGYMVGGGLQHFSVSPRPLGFGFWGFGVLGLRVGGQGLTKSSFVDGWVLGSGGLNN